MLIFVIDLAVTKTPLNDERGQKRMVARPTVLQVTIAAVIPLIAFIIFIYLMLLVQVSSRMWLYLYETLTTSPVAA